jgi:hypothetical protein
VVVSHRFNPTSYWRWAEMVAVVEAITIAIAVVAQKSGAKADMDASLGGGWCH